MAVCIPCRDVATWSPEGTCPKCGETLVSAPYRWSPPRKNNARAWKHIAKGEWLWVRRRVHRVKTRGGRNKDTVIKVKRRKVQVYPHPDDCDELICKHFGPGAHWGMYKMEEIPGPRREVPNMRQLPNVDLGG